MLRTLLPPSAQVSEVPLTTTNYFSVEHVEHELRSSPAFTTFETLVVTSTRAKQYLGIAMTALRENAQVFTVGRSTTRIVVGEGITVTGESSGSALQLVDIIKHGPVLLIGAETIRDELPEALHKRGLRIDHVACYETVPIELDDWAKEQLRRCDAVFIGAPSAWHVAQAFIEPSTWVIVPGLTTGAEVRATHERVIEGWEPSLRDILATLEP
jgi:uroporphyrinogen-III synthase